MSVDGSAWELKSGWGFAAGFESVASLFSHLKKKYDYTKWKKKSELFNWFQNGNAAKFQIEALKKLKTNEIFKTFFAPTMYLVGPIQTQGD